jgi:glycosyltransferase involved in cell wall biosynthesis
LDGAGAARITFAAMETLHGRVPVLYLAPWVDVGGSDKGTIDWFRFLDRDRFAPSLITTQPFANRRLSEVEAYADEVWELPQLMRGDDFPRFIFAFIASRGVRLVHIMNSRLAYELLPVMATLPDRPRTVVQLHVEEPDRSGYVRYVTTRYGNLVDAFSVTSHALSERLDAYDVPRAKRRLIRTGVDAQHEFNPARVKPVDGLDRSRLQIVFPARLTAQKDPLLMVDVAERLRARGVRFQLHVLGGGDLAEAVRRRVVGLGLQHEVRLHGDSLEVDRWYAACDLVLLTSRFEGLPYVAYEAMAMAVPLLAPRLPGLDELVTPDAGVLIAADRDPEPYADAIAALADDPARRERIGEAARSRVISEFSLKRMAAEHAALYEELLAERRPDAGAPEPRPAPSPSRRVAFRSRRPGSRPLVSVIVPCFNHGRYLPDCLDSIGRQLYEQIETILVDDGSTDPETLAALELIEHDRAVSLVRLPVRAGPGAARNVAIERAAGRYILPLDADNLLLPSAIDDLVEQLSNAGERIGFVYPNLQFFGNRQDYFEAPSYNLHGLLLKNYCDTASLVDREVFDCGVRYADYADLIHEDWDFVLALAERGIYGEPARKQTLLFRKHGFTRSDLVHIQPRAADAVRDRHAQLFADIGRIKAEWNPSLTLIALDPIHGTDRETVSNLVTAAHRQSCSDFELIVRAADELWPTRLGPRLRRVPSALARSRAKMLSQAVGLARGGYVLATYGSLTSLLSDRALVEKLLRLLQGDVSVAAVALADAGAGHGALRILEAPDAELAILGALCWRTTSPDATPVTATLPSDAPLEMLAMRLGFQRRVQWRHLSRRDSRSLARRAGDDAAEDVTIELARPRRNGDDARAQDAPAMLAVCPPEVAITLGSPEAWMPAQSRLLCRHLHEPTGRYIYSHSATAPHHCSASHVLGAVRAFPLAGTTSVASSRDGELLFGAEVPVEDPSLLGFLERAPLPLLDELLVGSDPRTGQRVLVERFSDPLAPQLEALTPVGFIEPYPIHPKTPPMDGDAHYGLTGLTRSVDTDARRHRYGAGHMPAGIPAGELGALLREPLGDCEPLWIDEHGSVFADGRSLSNGRPSVKTALRWIGAPLGWADFGPIAPKLRATVRRAYDSTRIIASRPAHPRRPAAPAGYLLRSSAPYTVPLYGALHPVTGDQLLSTSRTECLNLGYRGVVLLGHLVARAPVTGQLGPIRTGAAWTSRFGMPAAGT